LLITHWYLPHPWGRLVLRLPPLQQCKIWLSPWGTGFWHYNVFESLGIHPVWWILCMHLLYQAP
jgi:hypothetical protein